jgi:pimeloyl-ACP methyl ester carboxylesterase
VDINSWKQKGKFLEIKGHSIFYIQRQTEQPTICFLHGYPSASYDYHKILPFIENDFSYCFHDHPGFGFSSKINDYSYSLIEQAEIAIELWKQLGLKEIHLVAHDYGCTVANEIVVRKLQGFEPVKIKSVTFCNGSMHVELANLKWIQQILAHPYWGKFAAKFSNEMLFVKSMRDIWYDKTKFDASEIKTLYEMLQLNSSDEVFHKISQYNNERRKYWHRWIGALKQINFPVHILWAQQDPVAVKAIAEQLFKEIPNATYTKIDQCGHYPMLEQPQEWINKVVDFIKKI